MKYFLSLFVFLFVFTSAFAQRFELGFFCGGSYYIGDINPSKHFLLAKPAVGFVYRYNINSRFAAKLNVYSGYLYSSDGKAKFNEKRNLSFRSMILDISTEMELNFEHFEPGNTETPFTPYIFGGFSVFKFNPQAEYQGTWYNLQPLGTEGQGTSRYPDRHPYSLMSVAFPFGLGFKLNVTDFLLIGAEWGLRKTFTDYLDDVSTTYADPVVLSAEKGTIACALADRTIQEDGVPVNNTGLQRGNSQNKDWYSFAGLIITYRIKKKNGPCPAYDGKTKNKFKFPFVNPEPTSK